MGMRFRCSIIGLLMVLNASAQTVTRQWNEENLAAIRIDFPAPTVHARNLFHLSVAMWDAWAAFDKNAVGYLHNENASAPAGSTLQEAREEAISFAAYRVLRHHYAFSTNASTTLTSLDARMLNLGYDQSNLSTDGDSPAALGNRIAASIIDYSTSDGANESRDPGYRDTTGYSPVNAPLILSTNNTASRFPIGWNDLNRWQPMAFDVAFTQNGQIASKVQKFVSPHWGDVKAFGLFSYDRDSRGLYFDPGEPPKLGEASDLAYKNNAVEVLEYSALLDPAQSARINLSPSARGNNSLGKNDGTGHAKNPTTGKPYPDHFVLHADYGRCVAEYWADGPASETPPGHWNVLANEVTDKIRANPSLALQLGGSGEILDPMEWEVKFYLALNAALHNTAVAIWGVKAHYDYVRPVSAIRYLGFLRELPLVPGLVEVVTASTAQTYHRHLSAYIGEIAVNTWPGEPDDPATEVGGRAWILAQKWLPYQQDTFVTPAFAGYVSGHSGFSLAAAEVMALMTGTPYFPGGMFSHVIPAGELLFEAGPTTDITLQWATYFDAADEAGESRLYGGIHVSPDDGPGRVMGAQIGKAAFSHAEAYWQGSIFAKNPPIMRENGLLSCPTVPGYRYSFVSGTDLKSFPRVEVPPTVTTGHENSYVISVDDQDQQRFFRVEITAP